MECANCHVKGSADESLGHVVCPVCGVVLQDNVIVAEQGFSENTKGAVIADGFSVAAGQAHARNTGSFGNLRSGTQTSREITLQNGLRQIQAVASQPQIKLDTARIEKAHRYFNIAVNSHFTKGRKTLVVVAACLYIVCRQDQTAHQLIDFADALSINIFKIGSTFIELCRVAGVKKLPLVDPSLHIARFASKLEFGPKTNEVTKDAAKLVARMKKDWMAIGRRPSGLCAAALFMASRMHGFNRSINEIILIVKVCSGTVQKRLKEFQKTKSSELTIQSFNDIWLSAEHDPPSFNPPKNYRTEAHTDEIEEVTDIIKTMNRPLTHAETNRAIANYYKISSAPYDESHARFKPYDAYDEDEHEYDEDEGYDEEGDEAYDEQKEEAHIEEYDANLEDLDDDEEVLTMLDMTEEDVQLKEQLWMMENADYEQKQALKRLQEDQKGGQPKAVKRQKPGPKIEAGSAYAAVKQMMQEKPRLTSSKINYDVVDGIEKLFGKKDTSEDGLVDA